VWLLKTWLHFPRPWELLGWQPGLSTLPADADASFPSGHAAFAAVVVGSLWPRLRGRTARAALLLYLASVGFSRVMLGAHFPADVVAGYAVGLGSAWGAGHVLRGSGRRGAGGSDERPKEGEIAG
jgi:signal peptidase II